MKVIKSRAEKQTRSRLETAYGIIKAKTAGYVSDDYTIYKYDVRLLGATQDLVGVGSCTDDEYSVGDVVIVGKVYGRDVFQILGLAPFSFQYRIEQGTSPTIERLSLIHI